MIVCNGGGQITCLPGIDPAAYKMFLFNAAGAKVLQMDGLHPDFDGANLPDGVYWWVLQDLQGKSLQAGGVTIRRR